MYYVLCDKNCKYPALTKEQTLAAIAQAVETGEIKDVDTGFVTTIKEQNEGKGLKFWVGTQAQYNALANKADNCFYIITDDTFADDIKAGYEEMKQDIETLFAGVANMSVGVEYRTNERYNGRDVYVKLIDSDEFMLTYLSDHSKGFAVAEHSISNIANIIDVGGDIEIADEGVFSLPYVSYSSIGDKIEIGADKSKVYLTAANVAMCNFLAQYSTINVWIKYTKK